ncbi:MAG: LacI family DNA-binding transcriptional regulator [Acidimicrobiales bacterium]
MATMADVAKRAGVSVSTVSYALSGKRPISDATRLRIETAMADLDYTPNAFGRALKSQRSRILAFLLPTDVTATDAYMVKMLFAAAERARADGYHLLLWTESGQESLGVRELASDGLIDGVLLTSILMDDPRVDALDEAGVPFVTIGRTGDCATHLFVDTDDRQTASLVVEQLVAEGHRRVEFVGPPAVDFDRRVGIVVRLQSSLRAAATTAGLELRTSPCDFTVAAGLEIVRRRANDTEPPTAYVVMNPPALDGVFHGLDELESGAQASLSVIGLLTPSEADVTSVVADPAVLGTMASEVMIGALAGQAIDGQRLVGTTLVVGSSIRPAYPLTSLSVPRFTER